MFSAGIRILQVLQYPENSYDEKALLLQAAEGDSDAFTALYHALLPRLYPFLLRMLKSEEAVKEVLQEAFLRTWLNRDKLTAVESGHAWISRIAINECYRYLKKQGLQQQVQTLSAVSHAHDQNDGEARLALAETQQLVQEAIELLPARRKLIYTMSRRQGMKIPEIAQELNLSPGYVKKALVLSLAAIRQHLAAAGKLIVLLLASLNGIRLF